MAGLTELNEWVKTGLKICLVLLSGQLGQFLWMFYDPGQMWPSIFSSLNYEKKTTFYLDKQPKVVFEVIAPVTLKMDSEGSGWFWSHIATVKSEQVCILGKQLLHLLECFHFRNQRIHQS